MVGEWDSRRTEGIEENWKIVIDKMIGARKWEKE